MNNDVEIAKSFAYKQNQTHARLLPVQVSSVKDWSITIAQLF